MCIDKRSIDIDSMLASDVDFIALCLDGVDRRTLRFFPVLGSGLDTIIASFIVLDI
jgi:hypothetical protein